MRRKLQTLGVVLAAALVTGCHFIPDNEIFNNTNQDLSITMITSVDGRARSTTEIVKSGRAIFLGVPFKLAIRSGDSIWSYDLITIPSHFYRSIGANKRIARLQIEEDGSIYLLLPDAVWPVTKFPDQPVGYPIRAKKAH